MYTPFYKEKYEPGRFVRYPYTAGVGRGATLPVHPRTLGQRINREKTGNRLRLWAVVSVVLVELAAANVVLATVRLVHLFGG